MSVVAILGGSSGDDGATKLGADLGITAYDARQLLAAGYPAIIAMLAGGPGSDGAEALAASLREKGHDAIALHDAEVVTSEAMVAMEGFVLGDAAVTASAESLPYADIHCLLRATHREHLDTRRQVTEKRFNAGRALLTSGLSMRTSVTRQVGERTESREQVLYVFRRSAGRPWILHESARFTGLGPALGRTRVENFATTVRLLRERAPAAAYDERLVSHRRVPERQAHAVGAGAGAVTTTSSWGMDLLAHLVARSLGSAGVGGGPYRK
jgi:hypothetical protein